MKNKIIETYFPNCPKELIQYFKISWLDKSIKELMKIYINKNSRLTKNQKFLLGNYLLINNVEMLEFAVEACNNPILHLSFKQCLKEKSIKTIKTHKNLLTTKNTNDDYQVFITAILMLKEADKREKFGELQEYCERKLNDTEI